MAYQIIPSQRWQEILDMTDEYKQGKAATEYVDDLEKEIRILKGQIEELKHNQEIGMIDEIMKCKPFKQWLEYHDERTRNDVHDSYKDWSGLQGGL